MKITFLKSLILSLLLSSILLSGCGAVNYAIPVSDTIQGMQKVVGGSRDAFVFMNPNSNIVVLGWSVSKPSANYAFLLMDKNGTFANMKSLKDLPQAVGAQWKGTTDFLLFLENNGWKYTTAASLTPAIRQSIQIAVSLGTLGSVTPIILVLPATLNPLDMLGNKGRID